MKKGTPFALAAFLLVQGCASPAGSNWLAADFNKYDNNYSPFATSQIRIGQPKSEILQIFKGGTTVEAAENVEIIAFQKWASVPGPDYVEQTLYVRLVKGKVAGWKVTNDTVAIVPRAW
jgi:hypothetical protein